MRKPKNPPSSRYSLQEREQRQKEREEGFNSLLRVGAVTLFIFISFMAIVLLVTPHLELVRLEKQLHQSQLQYEQVLSQYQEAQKHLKRMDDPEYYENMARDRVHRARENERIIHPAKPELELEAVPEGER